MYSLLLFEVVYLRYETVSKFLHALSLPQDTGISVRKRVIKILRDICLEQPTFNKITEMCVRMIRRVNDEEGIKVLFLSLGSRVDPDQDQRNYRPYCF